jgi:hypothetical protein
MKQKKKASLLELISTTWGGQMRDGTIWLNTPQSAAIQIDGL